MAKDTRAPVESNQAVRQLRTARAVVATDLAIVQADHGASRLDCPAENTFLVMFGVHADEATSGQIHDQFGLLRQL